MSYDTRHPSTQHMMRQFEWKHLPAGLQYYSRRIGEAAEWMVANLPDSPELTTGLRKLLEAKDCFVRAAVDAKPVDYRDR